MTPTPLHSIGDPDIERLARRMRQAALGLTLLALVHALHPIW
jgi:hypothetical protein